MAAAAAAANEWNDGSSATIIGLLFLNLFVKFLAIVGFFVISFKNNDKRDSPLSATFLTNESVSLITRTGK